MRVYLDHNATSPLRDEAKEALRIAVEASFGNPSSIHAEGRRARSALESAREQVAGLAGVPPREVVFTSGASEAIAAAFHGIVEKTPPSRRRIVVSAIEHSAVLAAARAAAARGFDLVEIACSKEGVVRADDGAAAIDGRVALVALQAANNETGVLQPVADVGEACARAGAQLLVDAVQAAGRIPIERDRWRASLLALSGHKLGGPAGTGALIVKDGVRLAPLIGGGAQERRRRGGTEAVAALAAFGAACAAAARELPAEGARIASLRDRFESGLAAAAPELTVHGGRAPRLPNTTLVSFPGVSGEALVIALDLAGIAASTGSACASGAVEPSHVLAAMGLSGASAQSAVRFSLGWSTTAADVDRALDAVPGILGRARMAAS